MKHQSDRRKSKIPYYGLQSELVRRTGIPQPLMSLLFRGKKRANLREALALEKALIALGYRISRIDILYSKPGTPLMESSAAE